MKIRLLIIFASALILLFAAGCTGKGIGDKPALKELGKDDQAVIKVMYYDERSFFSQYGSLFLAKYPNIDVQVVSNQINYSPNTDMNKVFETFIEDEKPDVLMLSADQYEKFAGNGMLYDLDTVISQDKFDIQNIMPSIIEFLKAKGNGKLYGLAPNFYSQAIFYNKNLFDVNGVPYPQDPDF